jgi:hypothetical protein
LEENEETTMRRLMMSAGLCVSLLSCNLIRADVRLPDKKDEKKGAPVRLNQNVSITITYFDEKDKEQRPRLVIPKKFMVAAGDVEHVPLAEAPSGRMLFAGLACSAALVTGGLWFVRRAKGARGLLVLFIVSGVLSATAFVPQLVGNVPPPQPKVALPKVEINGRSAKTAVDVTVSADGDRIELFLPNVLTPAEMEKKKAPQATF